MLHTFKTGVQQWGFEFTIGNIMRLQEAGLDFLKDPTEDRTLAERLSTDIHFLFESIWQIIEPLAIEAGYSKSQFANLMQPENLIEARTTLFAAWAEFLSGLGKGPAATAISKIDLFQRTSEESMARAVENSESLDLLTTQFATSLERRLDREFAKLPAAFEAAMAALDAVEPTVDVRVITPAA